MKTINKYTKWLDTFNASDNNVDWGTISPEKYHSLRNMISRYNQCQGILKGIFLHHSWIYETRTIVVVCESLNEHKKHMENGQKDLWREKIPSTLD